MSATYPPRTDIVQPVTLDPPPLTVFNPAGSSAVLLVGDHAGNSVPAAMGSLGLTGEDLSRHIGWDIGVASLGLRLAKTMNATFIYQAYSRLVIDCNRRPDAVDAIPTSSDGTLIPGNVSLNDEERTARIVAIHEPYQQAIAGELDARRVRGQQTIIVSLHSFTPTMNVGVESRPWHIGVLHNLGDPSFAHQLLTILKRNDDLVVGDNEPYQMRGGWTIPRHAYRRKLRYAVIEVRQDLLREASGLEEWTNRLETTLHEAMRLMPVCTPKLQS